MARSGREEAKRIIAATVTDDLTVEADVCGKHRARWSLVKRVTQKGKEGSSEGKDSCFDGGSGLSCGRREIAKARVKLVEESRKTQ